MRRAWVIATGTELALGQSVDTNSPWLAARLAALGVRTERHVTVPDDLAALRDVLCAAAKVCDVILLTGGLGPTADDLTRQALADVAGVPLELHPPSLEHLRSFFAARGRTMPEPNVVQAMVPRGAQVLPNTCGTAPGLRVRLDNADCFALPGVPFEMYAMFEREVAPVLRATGAGGVLVTRQLRTFGLGESEVGQRLADLMQPGRNPTVGTTAEHGVIVIRLYAAGASEHEVQPLLDATEAEIRRRLGTAVFGAEADTLGGVVGKLLLDAGGTLSTAESCTGGLIGTLITDIPGSSAYYLGGVVSYANELKAGLLGVPRDLLERHGAVSEPVARAMAEGAAARLGTSHAVAVTGIAGPTGGTAEKPVGLVFIGVHEPGRTVVREFRFGSDYPRHVIRLRAAHTALNLLRLRLRGMES